MYEKLFVYKTKLLWNYKLPELPRLLCKAVAPKLKNLRRRSWGTKHLEGRSTLLSFFPRIVKATKSQKILSIWSNLKKNVRNYCPSTFLFELRTWGIVILHILLSMAEVLYGVKYWSSKSTSKNPSENLGNQNKLFWWC